MLKRWMLSQFFTALGGDFLPICAIYGARRLVPRIPTSPSGWALVSIMTSPQQVEAAKLDSRVVVCPLTFDPAAVDTRITDAYASMGATPGMNMGALLAKLSETEPLYAQEVN